MLYLALSALQGGSQTTAFNELAKLQPDGIQLTPGNHPPLEYTPESLALPIRTHHGFSLTQVRAPIWVNGELRWSGHSAHPPLAKHVPDDWDWLDAIHYATATATLRLHAVETMYPDYACLTNGYDIELAMQHNIPLAVDVAHLSIQRSKGLLTDTQWAKIQDYTNIVEIHCSHSSGSSDDHKPLIPAGSGHVLTQKQSANFDLDGSTFGLAWAKERLNAGTPVILECYMHKLSFDDRRRQLDIIRV